MLQPPVLWQRDADGAAAGAGGAAGGGGGVYDSDDRIADSWRHVKQVAREGAKDYDLIDLLQYTRREETYSFPIPGVRPWAAQCGAGRGGAGRGGAGRGQPRLEAREGEGDGKGLGGVG
jgi:hypothetical protein